MMIKWTVLMSLFLIYLPNMCRVGVKKVVAKRKKAITKTQTTQPDETNIDTVADTTIQPTGKMASKRSNDWSVNLNEFLRCMDADVLVLFEEKLELVYPLPKECIGKSLGLMEFK